MGKIIAGTARAGGVRRVYARCGDVRRAVGSSCVGMVTSGLEALPIGRSDDEVTIPREEGREVVAQV